MIDPVSVFLKYSMKKDYPGAVTAFEKLLKKSPNDTGLLFQLANAHLILGKNIKLALPLYNQVLKLDPSADSARLNRASCNYGLKKYKLAIKDLNIVLKSATNYWYYKKRSLCYEKLKDYKRAIKDLKMCSEVLEKQLSSALKKI